MRLSVRFAAPLLALLLVACSSDDTPSDPPPTRCTDLTQETCLTQYYFRDYQASKESPCAGFTASTQKVAARRELVLFFGGEATEGTVAAQGGYLQRFYDPYDLTFFTRQRAVKTPLVYALNGTSTQVGQAKYEAEKGKAPSPEVDAAVAKAINELIFGDLRKFIRANSTPQQKAINVVILDKIFSPGLKTELDSYEGGSSGTVVGLGLSPALFKNIAAGDPSTNLFKDLGLPEDFAPTLLVGSLDIGLGMRPDVIVSHELGHAMGLQHTTEPGGLMTQGQAGAQACTPGLNDQQVDALKSAATVVDTTCGWRRLVDFRNSLVRAAIARRTP